MFFALNSLARDAAQLFNQGYGDFVEGDYTSAIKYFNQAIAIGDVEAERLAFVYYHQGMAYSRLQSFQSAIDSFNSALQLHPELELVYRERGNAHSFLQQYELAVADYTRSMGLFSDDVDVLHNRGFAYYQLDRPEQATVDYSRVLQLEPDSVSTRFNRALAWTSLQEYEFVIKDSNVVLQHRPGDPDALNTRGKAHFSLFRFDLAIRDFNEAMERDPERWDSVYNRAIAYSKIGDVQAALADLKTASKLSADPNLIEAALSDLQNGNSALATLTVHDGEQARQPEPPISYDSIDPETLKQRGWSYYRNAQFDLAKQDFEHFMKLRPDDIYRILAVFISDAHAGRKASDTIQRYINNRTFDRWPGMLVQLFVGALTPEALADRIDRTLINKAQRCEASYYLAEYYLLGGHNEQAEYWFRETIKTNKTHFNEYKSALVHLSKQTNASEL